MAKPRDADGLASLVPHFPTLVAAEHIFARAGLANLRAARVAVDGRQHRAVRGIDATHVLSWNAASPVWYRQYRPNNKNTNLYL